MNDLAKPPVLFEVPAPLSEKVPTRNFGVVTMTSPAPHVIEKVFGNYVNGKDDEAPYRELVAECARGEKGERFTAALLANLPGQCFGDWLDLRSAVVRVCGLNREAVAKN
ncbi:hypothetical protein [Paraburkholderia unamae]|uniref:Uncharacterized protein n=1 Tax=Paraburkholderia unamae TaxID=219649 RepID=A0ACC6RQ51_9BURK